MLNLHGGGGTGAGQQSLSAFDSVADANNLLVVYPDGYDKSWADGRGASPADRRHVDDVGFLVALVGKLQSEFSVPAGHVFATGMSNGGFMSNRLACDRADVFAAIAPVAGTLGAGVACNPSRPVSVMEAHGTADPVVPFNGGKVRGRGGPSQAISAASMIDRWRAVDGCQGDPTMDELPNVGDGTVVRRYDSRSCVAGTEVIFYRIDNGGHTWPGGSSICPRRSSVAQRAPLTGRKPLCSSLCRTAGPESALLDLPAAQLNTISHRSGDAGEDFISSATPAAAE